MTRAELARRLNVSPKTLHNWENEKPELVRLINQGLLMDEIIEETEKNLEKLKKIKIEAQNKKFNI